MVYCFGELVVGLQELLNNDNDSQVVYIKNLNDDEYYTIKDIRIDDENDIVLDIELSCI